MLDVDYPATPTSFSCNEARIGRTRIRFNVLDAPDAHLLGRDDGDTSLRVEIGVIYPQADPETAGGVGKDKWPGSKTEQLGSRTEISGPLGYRANVVY